ncbi:MAG: CaiB/BaiF CoA-transferase family protein [Dehalococcoidia bacterium]|nr:CaiB/BaiF CoA-transferase family protein [Dehalococcoidia bacterium]
MTLPLEGIKVLDLSRTAPAAFCTMVLGDFGAEVLKIEQPQRGDTRPLGSSVSPRGPEGEREAAFNALNRNKRSIALDLQSAAGARIFHQLARTADVIIEGFRPGVVKRLGVDYESVARDNPGIVYCSLSGYGQDGPYRERPGHDLNYISIAGVLGVIGDSAGQPVIPSNIVGDYAGGGMQAALGILMALMGRRLTGKGQHVDVSITDAVLALLTREASGYFLTGESPRRGRSRLTGALPHYNVYESSDGKYLSVACLEPHFYEGLCRTLGCEDFIPYREAIRQDMFDRLRKSFLAKTRDEWLEFFQGKDVCISPVYDLDEVFSDPQVKHRGMVVEMEHPGQGKVRQVGIASKLAETPGKVRSLSPLLGQHTREVLGGLGYSDGQIEEMYQGGTVQ